MLPNPQLGNQNINSIQRFRRIEYLKQHFWHRFTNEYILWLQERTKWRRSSGQLKVGTLVLIKDKTSPPLIWSLGRILQILPGRDGVARVADIRTSKGVIQRAFNTICPLPVSAVEETSTGRGSMSSTRHKPRGRKQLIEAKPASYVSDTAPLHPAAVTALAFAGRATHSVQEIQPTHALAHIFTLFCRFCTLYLLYIKSIFFLHNYSPLKYIQTNIWSFNRHQEPKKSNLQIINGRCQFLKKKSLVVSKVAVSPVIVITPAFGHQEHQHGHKIAAFVEFLLPTGARTKNI